MLNTSRDSILKFKAALFFLVFLPLIKATCTLYKATCTLYKATCTLYKATSAM